MARVIFPSSTSTSEDREVLESLGLLKRSSRLFISKGITYRLLVTVTSGTIAARINGITIHAVYNILVNSSRVVSNDGSARIGASSPTSLRVDG